MKKLRKNYTIRDTMIILNLNYETVLQLIKEKKLRIRSSAKNTRITEGSIFHYQKKMLEKRNERLARNKL